MALKRCCVNGGQEQGNVFLWGKSEQYCHVVVFWLAEESDGAVRKTFFCLIRGAVPFFTKYFVSRKRPMAPPSHDSASLPQSNLLVIRLRASVHVQELEAGLLSMLLQLDTQS